MDSNYFAGRKVLVMGLGRFGGGMDAARFTASCNANVLITDLAPAEKLEGSLKDLKEFGNIEYRLGEHLGDDFAKADIVIVNPAVPPENKYLQIAREAGAVITSQIEIFFKLCTAPIVGITGANGKSTTTSLTAHLLTYAAENGLIPYNKVWLGGNIGNKPLLSILNQIKEDHLAVLEISSFQAEQLASSQLAPDISLITNLTPNHLDRHGTFEAYCDAKETLFRYQKPSKFDKPFRLERPVSIFNAEDEITVGWFKKYESDTNRVTLQFKAEASDALKKAYKLPGKANLLNLSAALTVVRSLGVDAEKLQEAVATFKSLPHRLELVAEKNGIGWYNDSIATTPPSVIAALDAFSKPKIVIAGGYDKKIPFDELGRHIAQKAKAAVLIGQTAEKIKDAIKADCPSYQNIITAENLDSAVKAASEIAVDGDVVLMSPACASYDMFDNFQQRGEIFRKLVNSL